MDKIKLKSLLIPDSTSIKQAMQKLNNTSVQILFVIDKDDKLLGTVTDGDIRRGLINGVEFSDKIEEDDFMGTAGSLILLKNKIKETFFVVNCDSILDVNFQEILDWHREHEAAMTIVGGHNEVKIPFGVLHLSNGRLEKILEKPVHDVIINTGVYIMEPHIISYISEGSQIDMNELIDIVAKKEKISVFPIYGGWFDIGQWDEYKKSIEKLEGIVSV